MSQELRSGYSTGTHATAILGAVLYSYKNKKNLKQIEVLLPQNATALIHVTYEEVNHFSTIKTDNDDMDVTKGCCIHVRLYNEKPEGLSEQNPSVLEFKGNKLYLYAGKGLGIVTKKGLKISPSFPAINPVPLEMMQTIASTVLQKGQERLHLVFSVDNGEEISKQTANAKVGVIGGISILGTRGIVKPISAGAYIDSIKSEISVVDANDYKTIVFTLGNSAHDYAKVHYDETQIVEIGNFIYDASELLKNKRFTKLVFITAVAKMAKVGQGFKNTHNRYGTMDFVIIKSWIKDELNFDLQGEDFLTLKAVLQTLPEDKIIPFVKVLGSKAALSFKKWFEELGLGIKEVETITLEHNKGIKKEIKW